MNWLCLFLFFSFFPLPLLFFFCQSHCHGKSVHPAERTAAATVHELRAIRCNPDGSLKWMLQKKKKKSVPDRVSFRWCVMSHAHPVTQQHVTPHCMVDKNDMRRCYGENQAGESHAQLSRQRAAPEADRCRVPVWTSRLRALIASLRSKDPGMKGNL